MIYLRYILLVIIIAAPTYSHAWLFGLSKHSEPLHNALVEAADVGNNSYVEHLIKRGYPVNSLNTEGQTALMKSAMRDNRDLIKTLIRNNANVNLQDNAGNTALHYAASHDHIAVSNELIKNGAFTDITNNAGQTALQSAIDSKSINVARLIDPNAVVAVETETVFPIVAAAGAGLSGTSVAAVGAGVAAAGAGVAVAAGGGGGSSSSSSSSSSGSTTDAPAADPAADPVTTTPAPAPIDVSGDPSSYETSEYYNSRSDYTLLSGSTPTINNGLGAIKASSAYARGASGSGITIAIVDTGVDLIHPDLEANILNSGINCINSVGGVCNAGSTAQDDNGHGSHVAGIAAATRSNHVYFTSGQETNLNMQGVAYSSKILPVKVIDSTGSGSSADIAAGVDYARTNGAKVINLSLGGITITGSDPFPEITTAIETAMTNNILVFAATGNNTAANPMWPAMNAATLNNTITTGANIAVASVDANNVISSFSNSCGTAMMWCLVAPGEKIHSTYWAGSSSYAVMDGTSMATPFASGAAAILLAEFPNLTPRQVAELLLETADRIADPNATTTIISSDITNGVNSTYGWGIINLDTASNPVGQVVVPLSTSAGGSSVTLSSSSIALSSAFGNSLQNSGVEFAILDSYNRAFTVGLSSITSTYDNKNDFTNSFDSFADPAISKVHMSDIGGNISMGFASSTNDNSIAEPEKSQESTTYFSMKTEAEGIKQTVNYNIPIAQSFGFGGARQLDGNIFPGDVTRGNPYLALTSDGISSISNFNFKDNNIHTNFAFFSGNNADSNDITSGVAAEIAKDFSNFSIASQFGFINEQNSFLGSHSSGAFAISNGNTPTWFYNLSTSVNITAKTSLFGVFSEGITKPEDAANSLISSVSAIRSRSFAGGIMRDSTLFKSDSLGLSVSRPLHVTSGSANITVPYGADINGNLYTTSQSLNLVPDGIETDIEAFYKVPTGDGILSFGATHKMQPGNIHDAESENLAMFKFTNQF